MKDLVSETEETLEEYINLRCGNCYGTNWKLIVVKSSNGKTFLTTMCANEECVKEQRLKQGIDNEDAIMIWDEFDITGQADHYEDDTKQTQQMN